MNQELSLRWWPWGKKQDQEKKTSIDETLDQVARLRAQADDELTELQAMVNTEDRWFRCFQVTEDEEEGHHALE